MLDCIVINKNSQQIIQLYVDHIHILIWRKFARIISKLICFWRSKEVEPYLLNISLYHIAVSFAHIDWLWLEMPHTCIEIIHRRTLVMKMSHSIGTMQQKDGQEQLDVMHWIQLLDSLVCSQLQTCLLILILAENIQNYLNQFKGDKGL